MSKESSLRKSLLDPNVHQECVARIEKLTADTKPQWGKMSAAQMLAHCTEVQEVMNGKPLENTPFIGRLLKGYVRKIVMNDTPYRRNVQTHSQYLIRDERDFETEKKLLLAALQKMVSMTEPERRQLRHALFGPMTDDEIGWCTYKHLDHHLTQFGV